MPEHSSTVGRRGGAHPGPRSRLTLAVASVAVLPLLASCSVFGGGDDKAASTATPVTELTVGSCLLAPDGEKDPEALVTEVRTVDCSQEHAMEVYQAVPYTPPPGTPADAATDVYPGQDALTEFADGTCAKEFRAFVGIDYLDSTTYLFTYLLPSPRSWEQDHDVLCIITADGQPLTGSAKDTRR